VFNPGLALRERFARLNADVVRDQLRLLLEGKVGYVLPRSEI